MRGNSAASRAKTRITSSKEDLGATLAVTPRLAAAQSLMTQRSINIGEASLAQAREVLHVTNTIRNNLHSPVDTPGRHDQSRRKVGAEWSPA